MFIEILACHNDNSSISFLKNGYKESDDPTYQEIENGNWYFNEAYGTIHRIASTGKVKRLTKTCFDFCHGKCNYLRIDIHKNNQPMQNAIKRYGFRECGIIHIEDDSERVAFGYKF